jgi:FkbM family methyltransferase
MNVNKTQVSRKVWKLFNKLENNEVVDFRKNGEENFLKYLISLQKKSFVAFDVGANVGNYTQTIIDIGDEVSVATDIHLFEPTKSCVQLLTKRFGSLDNIAINSYGLSDREEQKFIYYEKKMSGLSSLYKRNLKEYRTNLSKKEKVSLEKGCNYIKKENIKHINFIKIDVEGHELSVLNGFEKYINPSFVDFVQFEYGGCNIDSRTYLKDLYNFFEDRKFYVAKVMPKKLEVREYKSFMENFAYANYVAISSKIKYKKGLVNDYILW